MDRVEQGSSQVNGCYGKCMKTDFNSDGNPGIIDAGYNLRFTAAGRSEGAISFDQTRSFQTLQLLGYCWLAECLLVCNVLRGNMLGFVDQLIHPFEGYGIWLTIHKVKALFLKIIPLFCSE